MLRRLFSCASLDCAIHSACLVHSLLTSFLATSSVRLIGPLLEKLRITLSIEQVCEIYSWPCVFPPECILRSQTHSSTHPRTIGSFLSKFPFVQTARGVWRKISTALSS
ncbi:hypothetical protein BJ508DRAFT_145883 [Ascobolus immersus RN42]|uniref:Uncharacterized protein n=1 Tax=Ascobolus immersus RN42 TaxID=1160509 RepID=A0A3N4I4L4_ASCIM|nr:hypothetical protein BJ508DRAFT_145883 [Ascobolus immersus RN42]